MVKLRIPIIYFSASGNTEFICKLVKKGMDDRGIEKREIKVELVPVQRIMKNKLNFQEISIFGIASPIYEFNFSQVMRKWIKTIPITEIKKQIFLIDTSAGIPAAAIKLIENEIKKKNYDIIGSLEIVTPTIEPFFGNGWYPVSWKKAQLNLAYYFGAKIAENILRDKVDYLNFTSHLPGGHFLSKLIPFVESSIWKYTMKMGALIKFNKTKCIKCLKCEENCPMGAIKISRNNVINPFECMFCATCVRTCPADALKIIYRPNSKIPKKNEGPKLKKGYIDPDMFNHDKKIFYNRSLLNLL